MQAPFRPVYGAFGYGHAGGADRRLQLLKALRYGVSEEIGHATHACGHEPTLGPDQAHVSYALHKITEYRGHVGMREFIGQRDFGEESDAKAGQNAGPDRL